MCNATVYFIPFKIVEQPIYVTLGRRGMTELYFSLLTIVFFLRFIWPSIDNEYYYFCTDLSNV